MFRKTILVIVLFLIGFAIGNTAKAADVNGYTALYECRAKTVGEAGYANCNVDVATYTTAACQQIIHTSDAWSTINWAADVICIEAGDHTGKGTLTIPNSANGTSGNYKVLRYYRSGDTDDDPWDQSDGNKAKLLRLHIDSANYWIIHRLSFPETTTYIPEHVWVDNTTGGTPTNIILNRLHAVGGGTHDLYYGVSETKGNNITLQNSVISGFYGIGPIDEAVGVAFEQGSNNHIVNNEIFDYAAHPLQVGNNNGPTMGGLVIENNDVYQSTTMQTNGGANIGGEDTISIKAGAAVDNPMQIIHNRVWGARVTDLDVCCNGTNGAGIGINQLPVLEVFPEGGYSSSGSYQYTLIKNNIISESQWGISWYPSGAAQTSIIGNLFYSIKAYDSGTASYGIVLNSSETEIYLNSIIQSSATSIHFDSEPTNDVRCNTLISSGTKSGTYGTNTQADVNVFYDTTSFTTGSTNIDKTVNTRANSQAYSLNDIIRTTATPPADGTAGDFLYMVTTAGTSAGSPPSYTTTLGGTTTDGTMVVKAIRGPYSFWRKLRTTAEQVYIPYAKAHNSAPEYNYCPNTTGNRTGIGINNQTGTW